MNKNARSFLTFCLLTMGLTGLGGCATTPTDPDDRAAFEQTNDPLEPTNRAIFGFNQFVDHWLLRPVAKGYDYVMPEYAQNRVHYFLDNLGEPVNFFNNVLQGHVTDGAGTLGRFAVNTTFGGLGLFDTATDWDLPEKRGDFGQTLYTYGVGEGPYLVLPIFGPSNPRDGVGLAADIVMDPWSYVANAEFDDGTAFAITATRFGTELIDKRVRTLPVTDQLEKQSFDYYATIRSISRQYRARQLQGESTDVPGGASFSPSN